jgi:hypothetical protein
MFMMSNVKNRMQQNDWMRQQPSFVPRVVAQVRKQSVAYLRIHASGDFDSAEYITKWQEIATRCRKTTFWAYTRSWTEQAAEVAGEDLITPLLKLAELPNLQLWFSCDRDTGCPPQKEGVRRAYMAMTDEDKPSYRTDLVFRVKRTHKQVQLGETLVCPAERLPAAKTKEEAAKRATCAQCKLCFERVDWLDKANEKIRTL